MQHRHLNLPPDQRFILPAIDDIIERGLWDDWAELREAALASPQIMADVAHICRWRAADPSAQRHHFWLRYAEKYTTAGMG